VVVPKKGPRSTIRKGKRRTGIIIDLGRAKKEKRLSRETSPSPRKWESQQRRKGNFHIGLGAIGAELKKLWTKEKKKSKTGRSALAMGNGVKTGQFSRERLRMIEKPDARSDLG